MSETGLDSTNSTAPAAPRWLLKPWPHDPTTLQLVFLDHVAVPPVADFEAALDDARRRGVARLRTSAMFPRSAEVAASLGFAPIDELALLRRVLDDEFDRWYEAGYGLQRPDTRRLRRRHHAAAAAIDVDAFGQTWGNDADALAEIRRATPHHRARRVTVSRRMTGFAISGIAGPTGYIQRLAVAPAHRRRGHAQQLVFDALLWMRQRRIVTAYVNTGLGNDAALALYHGIGFTSTDVTLTISERLIER